MFIVCLVLLHTGGIYTFSMIDYVIFKNKKTSQMQGFCLWAHLGSNQAPPDYESDALTE